MQRHGLLLLALIFFLCLPLSARLVTPAAASTPSPATVGQGANPNELLIFEVNRPVTTADRGFPKDDPPQPAANGDWTTPINFAEGVMYYRVQVRSQPQAQNMRIQFCVWQDNFTLETCGPLKPVAGIPDTVVTWEQAVGDMWKLNDQSIDWTRPRQRYAIAIKNEQNLPVSNYSGWNWNGEDPDAWYPLDVRVNVVVVAKDQPFSGWHNYIEGVSTPTATPLPTATATTRAPTATATPTATPTATATPPAPTATATLTPTVEETATVRPTTTLTATATPTPTPTDLPPDGKSEEHALFLPLITR